MIFDERFSARDVAEREITRSIRCNGAIVDVAHGDTLHAEFLGLSSEAVENRRGLSATIYIGVRDGKTWRVRVAAKSQPTPAWFSL